MSKFFQVLFICIVFLIQPLSWAQTLCFKSIGTQSQVIRLALKLPEEPSKLGSIKYEHGTGVITIERRREKSISPKKSIPAVISTEFSEIVRGKLTGTYYLTTQGAVVGELVYKPARKAKLYRFMDDQDSYLSESCSWNIASKP